MKNISKSAGGVDPLLVAQDTLGYDDASPLQVHGDRVRLRDAGVLVGDENRVDVRVLLRVDDVLLHSAADPLRLLHRVRQLDVVRLREPEGEDAAGDKKRLGERLMCRLPNVRRSPPPRHRRRSD